MVVQTTPSRYHTPLLPPARQDDHSCTSMKADASTMSWDGPIINSRFPRFLDTLPHPLTCAAVEPSPQPWSWLSAANDFTFPSTTYAQVWSPVSAMSRYGLGHGEGPPCDYDEDCKEEIVDMEVGPSRRESWSSEYSTLSVTSVSTIGSETSVGGESLGARGRRASTVAGDEPASFVSTLYFLLNRAEYDNIIRFSERGDVVLFDRTSPGLLQLFTKYYRHSNANSFVRQLNNYGFTRINTTSLLTLLDPATTGTSAVNWTGFKHSKFWRSEPGNECDLTQLTTKSPASSGGKRRRNGA